MYSITELIRNRKIIRLALKLEEWILKRGSLT